MAENIYDNLITDCSELIKKKSESGAESEVAKYLIDTMTNLGFDRAWIDGYGNAVGIINGNGKKNILLQGHMDTVGVENPDLWKSPPYGGILDNNRLYGRGATDMKAALMAMLYAAASLIPKKEKLKGSIAVAGTVYEETFEGVAQGKVLDAVNPDLVLIGEASGLKLCIGQRGRAEIRVVTYGKPAHSSHPEAGVNAVKEMMKLFKYLESIKLPQDEFLGPAIMELTDIHSEPYPGRSVIPEKCTATFDRRLLPEETIESVLAPIREIIQKLARKEPTFQAEVEIVEAIEKTYTGASIKGLRYFPGWVFPRASSFVRCAEKALQETGLKSEISHYSFCTDGSQSAGLRKIPTLGFGPSKEELAHVVDEYIEVSEICLAYEGYRSLLKAFLIDRS